MSLVLGTNCGFVDTTPTADPNGGGVLVCATRANALKVVAPAGSSDITEIGIWIAQVTGTPDFQVGLYDHDSINNKPNNLLSVASGVIAGAGWNSVAINYAITAGTTYWIGVQVDASAFNARLDYDTTGGDQWHYKNTQTDLTDPWGTTSTNQGVFLCSIYSVYTSSGATGPANLKTYNTNVKANIKTININTIENCKSLNTNV